MIPLILKLHRGVVMTLMAVGLTLTGCRDQTKSATSQPSRQRLGAYFSVDEPIEYVYVPATDDQGQPPPEEGRLAGTVRRVTFLPGTTRYEALISALSHIGLTEPAREVAAFGVSYPNAPGVWGLERVPDEPTVHFSLLRQKVAEGRGVAMALGPAGLLLIECPGEKARKFRADCTVFEWLVVARPLESDQAR